MLWRRSLLAFLILSAAAPVYAQRSITKGSTDQTTYIRIVDSTDGTPETGVVAATSGLDLEYVRLGAAVTDLTESDLAAIDSAHSDGGIKHIGAGWYRVDLPDAACATGVNEVLVTGSCTGMVVLGTKHALVDFALVGQSAIDLKDFADDGYDPSINKVQGLVLADTVTTLTNLPAITANWLTATGIATDAITAAKIAPDAITNSELAADAIGASELATDAVGSAELAADAITNAEMADAAIDTSVLDTGAIRADVFAAGAIDAAAIQDNAIDAAAVTDSTWQELIELAFTFDATATYATANAGSLVKQIADNAGGSALTTDAIVEAMFTYDATATYATANAGSAVKQIADNAGGSALTVADIADGVWDEATAGHTTSGTFGEQAKTNVDAILAAVDTEVGAIKTKTDFLPSTTAGAAGGLFIAGSNAATTVNFTGNVTGNLTGSVGSVTGAVGSVTGNVGGNVVGTVASVVGNVGGNVVGSVASVTGAVTVGTNNDKTGYALTDASERGIIEEVFSYDATGTYATAAAGSLIKEIVDNVAGGGGGGQTQPRINRKPDPAFTFKVSRRADGTYACTSKLHIVPGTVETIHPAIDMSPLFGTDNFVETVGTPAISGGSLTVAAEGPRDWYAFVEVDGTATAGEARTITVPVTMTSGAVVQVKLSVEVFDE